MVSIHFEKLKYLLISPWSTLANFIWTN